MAVDFLIPLFEILEKDKNFSVNNLQKFPAYFLELANVVRPFYFQSLDIYRTIYNND